MRCLNLRGFALVRTGLIEQSTVTDGKSFILAKRNTTVRNEPFAAKHVLRWLAGDPFREAGYKVLYLPIVLDEYCGKALAPVDDVLGAWMKGSMAGANGYLVGADQRGLLKMHRDIDLHAAMADGADAEETLDRVLERTPPMPSPLRRVAPFFRVECRMFHERDVLETLNHVRKAEDRDGEEGRAVVRYRRDSSHMGRALFHGVFVYSSPRLDWAVTDDLLRRRKEKRVVSRSLPEYCRDLWQPTVEMLKKPLSRAYRGHLRRYPEYLRLYEPAVIKPPTLDDFEEDIRLG